MGDFQKAPYEDHPSRCQSVNAQGQCYNLGVELDDGSRANFCLAHGGGRIRSLDRKEAVRNYQLTIAKWRLKMDEKVDAEGIKSLREEIAILRFVLEERLNRCQDGMDLILQSQAISQMVMNIERVVSSCHKLEGSMGHLLDKQAVLQFAQVVIGIITKVLEGQDDNINLIADEILQTVGRIGGKELE